MQGGGAGANGKAPAGPSNNSSGGAGGGGSGGGLPNSRPEQNQAGRDGQSATEAVQVGTGASAGATAPGQQGCGHEEAASLGQDPAPPPTPTYSPSPAGGKGMGKGPMLVAIRLLEQLCVTVSTMLRDITKANDEAGA